MNQFEIRCAKIGYEASALMRHASDWREAKSMSMGELDLVNAERNLRSALKDVSNLLSLLREGRRETA